MSLAARQRNTDISETTTVTTESESPGSESFVHAPQGDVVAVKGEVLLKGVRHGSGPVMVISHDADDDPNDSTTAGRQLTATDNMRAKMALALEEHLHDDPDGMRVHYAHTLDLERASPKPCIVPGNALQLVDDDPQTPQTPTPIVIIANGGQVASQESPSEPETTGSSVDPENVAHLRRPVPKVRFRSRVRITSGVRKHRHSVSSSTLTPRHQTSSTCSSCSGSPSSSISAPLRWQADENATWAPLGRRLSAYTHANGWQKRSPTSQKQLTRGAKADERTPLMATQRARVAYVDSGLDGGGEADDERLVGGDYENDDDEEGEEMALRALALKREEDAVFGSWPWRLFNRHWWWWHVEPVLCCCCADDSDYDEFQ